MKRFEDFNWEFDEDDEDLPFQIGDIVVIKGDSYHRSSNDKIYIDTTIEWVTNDEPLPKFKGRGFKVIDIKTHTNKRIMKLESNWPWYDCSEWKIKN